MIRDYFQIYKKLFYTIFFLLITFFLGFLLYKLFFQKIISPTTTEPEINTSTSTNSTGIFPETNKTDKTYYEENKNNNLPNNETNNKITNNQEETENKIIKKINNTKSKNLSLNSTDNNINYYNEDDNKFYKLNNEGNISLLSDKQFYNVENITWSPVENKAIIEYPDGSNIVYNFDNQKQITLPKHWEDFDFSSDGSQIVGKSIGLDPENRWLLVSDSDGSKVTPIDKIGNNSKYIYPSWSPNEKSIAIKIEGVDFNRQKIYFIGRNNENFKSTTIEGRGFEYVWSPNGDRLLYSVYSSDDNMKPKLWIVNAESDDIGTSRKNLSVETWAHKCSFANDEEIYCAVPTHLEDGAGVFTDFAESSIDQLYKINTKTKQKTLIATPKNNTNISNITITKDSKYLYFTDNLSKNIQQVDLSQIK